MHHKIIEVGCGIIFRESKLLIAQRKSGTHLAGYWEFPGGKKEEGETLEECLIREINEELAICVKPFETIRVVDHVDPERNLKLYFVTCRFVHGQPQKKECMDYRWVKPRELYRFLFPTADRDLIGDLILKERYYFRRGNIL